MHPSPTPILALERGRFRASSRSCSVATLFLASALVPFGAPQLPSSPDYYLYNTDASQAGIGVSMEMRDGVICIGAASSASCTTSTTDLTAPGLEININLNSSAVVATSSGGMVVIGTSYPPSALQVFTLDLNSSAWLSTSTVSLWSMLPSSSSRPVDLNTPPFVANNSNPRGSDFNFNLSSVTIAGSATGQVVAVSACTSTGCWASVHSRSKSCNSTSPACSRDAVQVASPLPGVAWLQIATVSSANVVHCAALTTSIICATGGVTTGLVNVYNASDGGWSLITTLTAPVGTATVARFGAAVRVVRPGHVLVGAPATGSSATGAVYVYETVAMGGGLTPHAGGDVAPWFRSSSSDSNPLLCTLTGDAAGAGFGSSLAGEVDATGGYVQVVIGAPASNRVLLVNVLLGGRSCSRAAVMTGFDMRGEVDTGVSVASNGEQVYFSSPTAAVTGGVPGRLYSKVWCFPNRYVAAVSGLVRTCGPCPAGRYSPGGDLSTAPSCTACATPLPPRAVWMGPGYGCAYTCTAGGFGSSCAPCSTYMTTSNSTVSSPAGRLGVLPPYAVWSDDVPVYSNMAGVSLALDGGVNLTLPRVCVWSCAPGFTLNATAVQPWSAGYALALAPATVNPNWACIPPSPPTPPPAIAVLGLAEPASAGDAALGVAITASTITIATYMPNSTVPLTALQVSVAWNATTVASDPVTRVNVTQRALRSSSITLPMTSPFIRISNASSIAQRLQAAVAAELGLSLSVVAATYSNASVLQVSIPGLLSATSYRITLAGCNAGGCGTLSPTAPRAGQPDAVTLPPVAPTAPSALRATGMQTLSGGAAVNVTWTPPVDMGGAPLSMLELCIVTTSASNATSVAASLVAASNASDSVYFSLCNVLYVRAVNGSATPAALLVAYARTTATVVDAGVGPGYSSTLAALPMALTSALSTAATSNASYVCNASANSIVVTSITAFNAAVVGALLPQPGDISPLDVDAVFATAWTSPPSTVNLNSTALVTGAAAIVKYTLAGMATVLQLRVGTQATVITNPDTPGAASSLRTFWSPRSAPATLSSTFAAYTPSSITPSFWVDYTPTTSAACGDAFLPIIRTGVACRNASGSTITLEWGAPSDPGGVAPSALSYIIQVASPLAVAGIPGSNWPLANMTPSAADALLAQDVASLATTAAGDASVLAALYALRNATFNATLISSAVVRATPSRRSIVSVVSALYASTRYFVRIAAMSAAGTSAYSDSIMNLGACNTVAASAPLPPPLIRSSLSFNASALTVVLPPPSDQGGARIYTSVLTLAYAAPNATVRGYGLAVLTTNTSPTALGSLYPASSTTVTFLGLSGGMRVCLAALALAGNVSSAPSNVLDDPSNSSSVSPSALCITLPSASPPPSVLAVPSLVTTGMVALPLPYSLTCPFSPYAVAADATSAPAFPSAPLWAQPAFNPGVGATVARLALEWGATLTDVHAIINAPAILSSSGNSSCVDAMSAALPVSCCSNTTLLPCPPLQTSGSAVCGTSPRRLASGWVLLRIPATSESGGAPITSIMVESSVDGFTYTRIPANCTYMLSTALLGDGTNVGVLMNPPALSANIALATVSSGAVRPQGRYIPSQPAVALSNATAVLPALPVDAALPFSLNASARAFVNPVSPLSPAPPDTVVFLTGLLAGASYLFRVTPRNAAGTAATASPSTSFVVMPSALTRPSPPTGVSATVSRSGSVQLAWFPPLDAGGAQLSTVTYTVYSYVQGASMTLGNSSTNMSCAAGTLLNAVPVVAPFNRGDLSLPGWTVQAASITSAAFISGLRACVTYAFAVTASNTAGESDASSPLSGVSMPPPVPAAPLPSTSILITSVNASSVSVSWQDDAADGGAAVTSYLIQLAAVNASSWTSACTPQAWSNLNFTTVLTVPANCSGARCATNATYASPPAAIVTATVGNLRASTVTALRIARVNVAGASQASDVAVPACITAACIASNYVTNALTTPVGSASVVCPAFLTRPSVAPQGMPMPALRACAATSASVTASTLALTWGAPTELGGSDLFTYVVYVSTCLPSETCVPTPVLASMNPNVPCDSAVQQIATAPSLTSASTAAFTWMPTGIGVNGSVLLTELAASTAYYITVAAVTAAGMSLPSPVAGPFVTLAADRADLPPPVLAVTAGPTCSSAHPADADMDCVTGTAAGPCRVASACAAAAYAWTQPLEASQDVLLGYDVSVICAGSAARAMSVTRAAPVSLPPVCLDSCAAACALMCALPSPRSSMWPLWLLDSAWASSVTGGACASGTVTLRARGASNISTPVIASWSQPPTLTMTASSAPSFAHVSAIVTNAVTDATISTGSSLGTVDTALLLRWASPDSSVGPYDGWYTLSITISASPCPGANGVYSNTFPSSFARSNSAVNLGGPPNAFTLVLVSSNTLVNWLPSVAQCALWSANSIPSGAYSVSLSFTRGDGTSWALMLSTAVGAPAVPVILPAVPAATSLIPAAVAPSIILTSSTPAAAILTTRRMRAAATAPAFILPQPLSSLLTWTWACPTGSASPGSCDAAVTSTLSFLLVVMDAPNGAAIRELLIPASEAAAFAAYVNASSTSGVALTTSSVYGTAVYGLGVGVTYTAFIAPYFNTTGAGTWSNAASITSNAVAVQDPMGMLPAPVRLAPPTFAVATSPGDSATSLTLSVQLLATPQSLNSSVMRAMVARNATTALLASSRAVGLIVAVYADTRAWPVSDDRWNMAPAMSSSAPYNGAAMQRNAYAQRDEVVNTARARACLTVARAANALLDVSPLTLWSLTAVPLVRANTSGAWRDVMYTLAGDEATLLNRFLAQLMLNASATTVLRALPLGASVTILVGAVAADGTCLQASSTAASLTGAVSAPVMAVPPLATAACSTGITWSWPAPTETGGSVLRAYAIQVTFGAAGAPGTTTSAVVLAPSNATFMQYTTWSLNALAWYRARVAALTADAPSAAAAVAAFVTAVNGSQASDPLLSLTPPAGAVSAWSNWSLPQRTNAATAPFAPGAPRSLSGCGLTSTPFGLAVTPDACVGGVTSSSVTLVWDALSSDATGGAAITEYRVNIMVGTVPAFCVPGSAMLANATGNALPLAAYGLVSTTDVATLPASTPAVTAGTTPGAVYSVSAGCNTTVTIVGLRANTLYTFGITAVNNYGASPVSPLSVPFVTGNASAPMLPASPLQAMPPSLAGMLSDAPAASSSLLLVPLHSFTGGCPLSHMQVQLACDTCAGPARNATLYAGDVAVAGEVVLSLLRSRNMALASRLTDDVYSGVCGAACGRVTPLVRPRVAALMLRALTASTNYSVQYAITNACGVTSVWSAPTAFTTAAAVPPGPPPAPLALSSTASTVTLAVRAPSETGGSPVTAYTVHASTCAGCVWDDGRFVNITSFAFTQGAAPSSGAFIAGMLSSPLPAINATGILPGTNVTATPASRRAWWTGVLQLMPSNPVAALSPVATGDGDTCAMLAVSSTPLSTRARVCTGVCMFLPTISGAACTHATVVVTQLYASTGYTFGLRAHTSAGISNGSTAAGPVGSTVINANVSALLGASPLLQPVGALDLSGLCSSTPWPSPLPLTAAVLSPVLSYASVSPASSLLLTSGQAAPSPVEDVSMTPCGTGRVCVSLRPPLDAGGGYPVCYRVEVATDGLWDARTCDPVSRALGVPTSGYVVSLTASSSPAIGGWMNTSWPSLAPYANATAAGALLNTSVNVCGDATASAWYTYARIVAETGAGAPVSASLLTNDAYAALRFPWGWAWNSSARLIGPSARYSMVQCAPAANAPARPCNNASSIACLSASSIPAFKHVLDASGAPMRINVSVPVPSNALVRVRVAAVAALFTPALATSASVDSSAAASAGAAAPVRGAGVASMPSTLLPNSYAPLWYMASFGSEGGHPSLLMWTPVAPPVIPPTPTLQAISSTSATVGVIVPAVASGAGCAITRVRLTRRVCASSSTRICSCAATCACVVTASCSSAAAASCAGSCAGVPSYDSTYTNETVVWQRNDDLCATSATSSMTAPGASVCMLVATPASVNVSGNVSTTIPAVTLCVPVNSSLPGASLVVTDTALRRATSYGYVWTIATPSSSSLPSNPLLASTSFAPPTAPTISSVTGVTPVAAVVSWTTPVDDGGLPLLSYTVQSVLAGISDGNASSMGLPPAPACVCETMLNTTALPVAGWTNTALVAASTTTATLPAAFAPSTYYFLRVAASTQLFSSPFAPAWVMRTLDPVPCPGLPDPATGTMSPSLGPTGAAPGIYSLIGNGRCSGRGSCHAWSGTCTCDAHYAQPGCVCLDGYILDVGVAFPSPPTSIAISALLAALTRIVTAATSPLTFTATRLVMVNVTAALPAGSVVPQIVATSSPLFSPPPYSCSPACTHIVRIRVAHTAAERMQRLTATLAAWNATSGASSVTPAATPILPGDPETPTLTAVAALWSASTAQDATLLDFGVVSLTHLGDDSGAGSTYMYSYGNTTVLPRVPCEAVRTCSGCLALGACGWCASTYTCVLGNGLARTPAYATCPAFTSTPSVPSYMDATCPASCASLTNCSACAVRPDCAWCDRSKQCIDGFDANQTARACPSGVTRLPGGMCPIDRCALKATLRACAADAACGWCAYMAASTVTGAPASIPAMGAPTSFCAAGDAFGFDAAVNRVCVGRYFTGSETTSCFSTGLNPYTFPTPTCATCARTAGCAWCPASSSCAFTAGGAQCPGGFTAGSSNCPLVSSVSSREVCAAYASDCVSCLTAPVSACAMCDAGTTTQCMWAGDMGLLPAGGATMSWCSAPVRALSPNISATARTCVASCGSTTQLTDSSGVLQFGSAGAVGTLVPLVYKTNAGVCTWTICPMDVIANGTTAVSYASLALTVTAWDLNAGDTLAVYDGTASTLNAPISVFTRTGGNSGSISLSTSCARVVLAQGSAGSTVGSGTGFRIAFTGTRSSTLDVPLIAVIVAVSVVVGGSLLFVGSVKLTKFILRRTGLWSDNNDDEAVPTLAETTAVAQRNGRGAPSIVVKSFPAFVWDKDKFMFTPAYRPPTEVLADASVAKDDGVKDALAAAAGGDATSAPVEGTPPANAPAATASGADVQCTICQCDVDNGEEVRVLLCRHVYHVSCVDTWLALDKRCPVCKRDVCIMLVERMSMIDAGITDPLACGPSVTTLPQHMIPIDQVHLGDDGEANEEEEEDGGETQPVLPGAGAANRVRNPFTGAPGAAAPVMDMQHTNAMRAGQGNAMRGGRPQGRGRGRSAAASSAPAAAAAGATAASLGNDPAQTMAYRNPLAPRARGPQRRGAHGAAPAAATSDSDTSSGSSTPPSRRSRARRSSSSEEEGDGSSSDSTSSIDPRRAAAARVSRTATGGAFAGFNVNPLHSATRPAAVAPVRAGAVGSMPAEAARRPPPPRRLLTAAAPVRTEEGAADSAGAGGMTFTGVNPVRAGRDPAAP